MSKHFRPWKIDQTQLLPPSDEIAPMIFDCFTFFNELAHIIHD